MRKCCSRPLLKFDRDVLRVAHRLAIEAHEKTSTYE
jgi:hypothetical protein